MSRAVERIVVQANVQEKKAIAVKAKELGLSISELMRRGAAAYWPTKTEEELGLLADKAKAATERACAAIDDSLAFVAESDKRISAMEAAAASARKAG